MVFYPAMFCFSDSIFKKNLGVARIDSAKGESSYAQHSYTEKDTEASDDTQSADESILKDHSDNWWNLIALCSRVFRYVCNYKYFFKK